MPCCLQEPSKTEWPSSPEEALDWAEPWPPPCHSWELCVSSPAGQRSLRFCQQELVFGFRFITVVCVCLFRKLDVLQKTAEEISSQTGNKVFKQIHKPNQDQSWDWNLNQSLNQNLPCSVFRSTWFSVTSKILRPSQAAWTWWRVWLDFQM